MSDIISKATAQVKSRAAENDTVIHHIAGMSTEISQKIIDITSRFGAIQAEISSIATIGKKNKEYMESMEKQITDVSKIQM
jgi:methyl-accepting chemotaxis protein